MKNVMIALAAVATIGLTSCGGESAEDIKVEDLKEACDCVDAMTTITDEMLSIVDGVEDEKDLSEDDKKKIETLSEKMQEVSKHCKSEFDKDEAKDCDGADELKEKGEELMEKGKLLR